jgi:hypothetical protein
MVFHIVVKKGLASVMFAGVTEKDLLTSRYVEMFDQRRRERVGNVSVGRRMNPNKDTRRGSSREERLNDAAVSRENCDEGWVA